MNKDIIVQVAFKGAIKCVVNGKSDISEVEKLTNTFTDIMLNEVKQRQDFAPEVKVPFESEPPNEPINNGGDISNKASVKQENYVKKLFSQLPQEEKLKYADGIKAEVITWQYADEHIKKFRSILGFDDKPQTNQSTTKSDLPF